MPKFEITQEMRDRAAGTLSQGKGKPSKDEKTAIQRNRDYLHPIKGAGERFKAEWALGKTPLQGIAKTAGPPALLAAGFGVIPTMGLATWGGLGQASLSGALVDQGLSFLQNDRPSTLNELAVGAGAGALIPVLGKGVRPVLNLGEKSIHKGVHWYAKKIGTDKRPLYNFQRDLEYIDAAINGNKEDLNRLIKYKDDYWRRAKTELNFLKDASKNLPKESLEFHDFLNSKKLNYTDIKKDPEFFEKMVNKFIRKQSTSVRGVSFVGEPLEKIDYIKNQGYSQSGRKGGDMLGNSGIYVSNSPNSVAKPFTKGDGMVFYVRDKTPDLLKGLSPEGKLARLNKWKYTQHPLYEDSPYNHAWQRSYHPTTTLEKLSEQRFIHQDFNKFRNNQLFGYRGGTGVGPVDKTLFQAPKTSQQELLYKDSYRDFSNFRKYYLNISTQIKPTIEKIRFHSLERVKLQNPWNLTKSLLKESAGPTITALLFPTTGIGITSLHKNVTSNMYRNLYSVYTGIPKEQVTEEDIKRTRAISKKYNITNEEDYGRYMKKNLMEGVKNSN